MRSKIKGPPRGALPSSSASASRALRFFVPSLFSVCGLVVRSALLFVWLVPCLGFLGPSLFSESGLSCAPPLSAVGLAAVRSFSPPLALLGLRASTCAVARDLLALARARLANAHRSRPSVVRLVALRLSPARRARAAARASFELGPTSSRFAGFRALRALLFAVWLVPCVWLLLGPALFAVRGLVDHGGLCSGSLLWPEHQAGLVLWSVAVDGDTRGARGGGGGGQLAVVIAATELRNKIVLALAADEDVLQPCHRAELARSCTVIKVAVKDTRIS